MGDSVSRPELIKKLFDRLFHSGSTLAKLKDAVISERLYPGPTDAMNVAGRSLAWKLFLEKEEPLQAALPPRSSVLLDSVRASRQRYLSLLEEKTRAPDGNISTKSRIQRTEGLGAQLNLNNPLSLDDKNPWNEYFAGIELKKVILQDVERTFPDIPFFREPDVQEQLTTILFLYSITVPSIGYRQGMHELLAPLYHAVCFDVIHESNVVGTGTQYADLLQLCSAEYAAADAWTLFSFVMNGVSQWYEWQKPPEDKSLFSGPQGLSLKSIQPYVAPIVQACNHIQNDLLQACDPVLYRHMNQVGIEPQLYGIRWLRLLFTREFNMPDALKLWDGLFSCDSSLVLAQWVCVAMLIRIRNELIPADYSGQLTTLLRYPNPPSSSRMEGAPHHAILLLRQALALQISPNPATGATIVMENNTLLNIPIETPTSPLPSPMKRKAVTRPPLSPHVSGAFPGQSDGSIRQANHGRQGSNTAGLSEMFTRSLVERGENLGINKTLMNAVTEIRRNIPELAASLGVRTPNQTSSSTFPMMDERPIEERPPWEPRTRFEVEKDMTDIRSRDKVLGETLAWVVDTLLQDETESKDAERMRSQKREALESLSYVRDVLMMNSMDLDTDRLVGSEEKLRRRQKLQKEKDDLLAASASAMLNPPAPVPTADTHFKHSAISPTFPSNISQMPKSPIRAHSHFVDPSGKSTSHLAPWNHTRSSFGSTTPSVPPALMPRPPPPTSTALRRDGNRLPDQTPSKAGESYMDPLGALR